MRKREAVMVEAEVSIMLLLKMDMSQRMKVDFGSWKARNRFSQKSS